MVSELVTATGVWAGIGYGVDRLLGSWPVAFAIGAVVGNGTGVYMVYRRSQVMAARARRGEGNRGERPASPG